MKKSGTPVCAKARQGGHIDYAAPIVIAKGIERGLLDGDKLALYLDLVGVLIG
jgi:hypothetical protein